MSMSSVAYFLEKNKLVILLIGTETRDSNSTFKTPRKVGHKNITYNLKALSRRVVKLWGRL